MNAATISECGQYRYTLTREWLAGYGRVVFVMLNPSTADATQDDPTIRRCIGFAKALGAGALDVVNLYALRATNPRELWKVADPIGPDNDAHIRRVVQCEHVRYVIAAWGKNAKADRVRAFAKLVHPTPLHALRTSADGTPHHPLYLPGDLKPVRFSPPHTDQGGT